MSCYYYHANIQKALSLLTEVSSSERILIKEMLLYQFYVTLLINASRGLRTSWPILNWCQETQGPSQPAPPHLISTRSMVRPNSLLSPFPMPRLSHVQRLNRRGNTWCLETEFPVAQLLEQCIQSHRWWYRHVMCCCCTNRKIMLLFVHKEWEYMPSDLMYIL